MDRSNIILMVVSDIIGKVNEYLEESVEYELYEISNNFKIFLNYFTKNVVENIND